MLCSEADHWRTRYYAACAERDQARAELDRCEAARLEEQRLRTLGGTPPPCDQSWANLALPPPDTATADEAPPLHRPTIGETR